MDGKRRAIVLWVGAEILPHEGKVRAWLRRSRVTAEDADDLIQEAYCRISALDSFDRISRPDAYFFQIVRNLLTEQIRRARVVRIETVAEIDTLPAFSEVVSPEHIAGARQELAQVRRLIAGLPERCRRIVELRKIEGLSQRDIATRLGVSESIVENDAAKGLRLIQQALRDDASRHGGEQ